jgi:LysR family transcriptional regulator, transcriptional activator of nhaA
MHPKVVDRQESASSTWMNYHHLLYFCTVVREGGIARAAEKLRLSQPTISTQIRQLETSLGERLLQKQGRTVVPTEVGRVVFRYGDEIFSIGRELREILRGRPASRPLQLTIGVADAVPKLIAYRLLRPVSRGDEAIRIVCREGHTERLLGELATHALDVVITDAPARTNLRVKAFSHLLGESDIGFFAPCRVAARIRRGFPASLRAVPVVLPTANTPLRRDLDDWFDSGGIAPRVVGEFEDTALMKAFGQGVGAAFPAPAAIAPDICRMYGVRMVGQTSAVRERYYALSVERRLKHPGVLALTTAARQDLFAP